LVQRCDVFALACRRDSGSGDQDGIPVSLMEALAAGRCVITSDLAPITELVIDGHTGLCAPEASPGELAMVIRRAIGDAGRRERLGEAGRAHVVREFNRQGSAQRLQELFAGAIEARMTDGARAQEYRGEARAI